MRKIILLFIMMGGLWAGYGQTGDAGQALQALRKLVQTYQQAQLLGFDIRYTYAKEEKPGQYLDSLSGQCRLHGNRYWSRLANTESIYDGQLLLLLFAEDSLMYLTKPNAATMAMNPLALLDTFLLQHKEIVWGYSITGSEQLISMTLPETMPYKKVTYHMDRKTGYLSRVTSLVRSDQLYDPSVRSLVEQAATVYVVVEAVYSHYSEGAFDESIFDLNRYFKKEGTAYMAQKPYERYKVFLGSTGL